VLTDTQKKVLKRYLEEGGFLVAEACCGAASSPKVHELMQDDLLFGKDNPMQPCRPSTASASARPDQAPEFPELAVHSPGLQDGVIFSPKPLAAGTKRTNGTGRRSRRSNGPAAFRLAGTSSLRTGLEPPTAAPDQNRGAG